MKQISSALYLLLIATFLVVSCANTDESSLRPENRYPTGEPTTVDEPYPVTDTNYTITPSVPEGGTRVTVTDLIQQMTIAKYPWYGYTKEDIARRDGAKCSSYGNKVDEIAANQYVQGIVTFHPRFFKKVGFCGFDSRNYGSFWIQDETGGIQVIRDSRIADFDLGDEIRFRVRGVASLYEVPAIIAIDNVEVLRTIKQRQQDAPSAGIYYQSLTDLSKSGDYEGRVVRFKGKVVSEPTNYNFNAVCLVAENATDLSPCEEPCLSKRNCHDDKRLFLTVDREIGQRNPKPIQAGQILTVTGPLSKGYNGYEIAVSKVGQYSIESE